jgi:hypothetical protein
VEEEIPSTGSRPSAPPAAALCQLDGVKSLTRHSLPVPGGLDVLVHGLLHVAESDVELAHLLSEGGPTR